MRIPDSNHVEGHQMGPHRLHQSAPDLLEAAEFLPDSIGSPSSPPAEKKPLFGGAALAALIGRVRKKLQ